VAVRGTQGVKVHDFPKFMQAVTAGKKVLAANAVTGQGLPAYAPRC
jgi:aldehyde:ferredoxin oxidoreductase